jgi:hypothetical protein
VAINDLRCHTGEFVKHPARGTGFSNSMPDKMANVLFAKNARALRSLEKHHNQHFHRNAKAFESFQCCPDWLLLMDTLRIKMSDFCINCGMFHMASAIAVRVRYEGVDREGFSCPTGFPNNLFFRSPEFHNGTLKERRRLAA